VRDAIDESERAISGFTMVKRFGLDDCTGVQINPARERYAMLRQIDRIFVRIEVSHFYCIYN